MPSGINNNRPSSTPVIQQTGVNNETSAQTTEAANSTTSASPSPGSMTPEMAQTLGRSESLPSTGKVLETYFAPYDDTRAPELKLLDEVISARKADTNTYTKENNPYKIRYAVYNISSKEVLQKLAEAHKSGVNVQVLIEDHQLNPEKTWNQGDDYLREQGFSFAEDHNKLDAEGQQNTELIGIKRDTLMHLKSRIVEYPDPETGQTVKKLLTGSMNPGQSAIKNDENLSLITDQGVVDRYIEMYEAVRDNGKIKNEFNEDQAINVMFTGDPVDGGPRVTDQIFKMIDQEDEAIFLSVFTLRNLTTPSERTSLVKKLKAAKERGVEVMVITDKKQSDGVDSAGNRRFYDDWTEDKLRDAGITVYEALNEAGPYNAMHAKSAIFGLSDMKIITDTGNWTKAALGNWRDNTAQNEESYLFIDSKKLDDNTTGLRYLGNYMHLLRKYAPQNPENPGAEETINRLAEHPNWPKVNVDFSVMAHTFMGQDVYITGDHPSLGNWTQEGPGLKLNTKPGKYPFWESGGSLELPFGTTFNYKVVKRNPDGSLDWQPGENDFLIVDPSDKRYGAQDPSDPLRQVRTDEF